jgi:hypothetical protein
MMLSDLAAHSVLLFRTFIAASLFLVVAAEPATAKYILGQKESWLVTRSQDEFTDEVSCQVVHTASHDHNIPSFLFATRDTLVMLWIEWIETKVKQVQWRLDNRQIKTKVPKRKYVANHSAYHGGLTLNLDSTGILDAERLRIRLISTQGRTWYFDYRLPGLADALNLLNLPDCPQKPAVKHWWSD